MTGKAASRHEPRRGRAPLRFADGLEDDFYARAFEQAELLRLKRFGEMDLANLVEVESMGREPRQALRSSYRVLIAHLLKWQFQPSHRSRSPRLTILRERDNIVDREGDNPSLKADAEKITDEAYRSARRAFVEMRLPPETFPLGCPYSLDQLRDHDYLPE